MQERRRFIDEVRLGDRAFAELCRVYGIARKTGYKWLKRFELYGYEGLVELPRLPLARPNATPEPVVQALVAERLRRPHWGPKKLVEVLRRDHGLTPPAPSTAGAILKREGLITPRRRRKPASVRSWPDSLTVPSRPNQVWAADFKGWFRTADGAPCHPLTVSDLHSRYVLGCDALPGQRFEPTRAGFVRLFARYGLPEVIRVDNGIPFSTNGVRGLSRLSVFWLLQDVAVEFIHPGRPEQNGCHERMHRTLKAEATRPPAADLRAQQARFDAWREEFNEARPHEGLAMRRPAEAYAPSQRLYQGREDFDYPPETDLRQVHRNGTIRWRGRAVYVGEAFAGITLGLRPALAGGHVVYAGDTALGRIGKPPGGLGPLATGEGRKPKNHEGQRRKGEVLPMCPV